MYFSKAFKPSAIDWSTVSQSYIRSGIGLVRVAAAMVGCPRLRGRQPGCRTGPAKVGPHPFGAAIIGASFARKYELAEYGPVSCSSMRDRWSAEGRGGHHEAQGHHDEGCGVRPPRRHAPGRGPQDEGPR